MMIAFLKRHVMVRRKLAQNRKAQGAALKESAHILRKEGHAGKGNEFCFGMNKEVGLCAG